ncbi:hypothetical protein EV359DRAFT_59917 [Lentinula novae-zelandiae]|nr:hypothetical protein EV359DRAFT_59917 [Lentinula novae-zelandiae]
MSQTALKYMLSDGAINTISDVMLTQQTKLSELHKYPLNILVAYPSTGQYYVGHLIPNNPSAWQNIQSEIQYSLGSPRGQVNNAQVHVLVNELSETVPCIRKFATWLLQTLLKNIISCCIDQWNSLPKKTFICRHWRCGQHSKTMGVFFSWMRLLHMFLKNICTRPISKGYLGKQREVLQANPLVKVNFICLNLEILLWSDAHNSKKHLNFMVSTASYNTVYFQALFNNNKALLEVLEGTMKNKGYGPLVSCTTVQNCTSVKVNHIPIPARTPSSIVDNLIKFLTHLDDLLNLTARRLLGNEAAKFFLKRELPNLAKPTFSDLHPLLGNLDHMQDGKVVNQFNELNGLRLKCSISGVLHLKMAQDASRAVADHYIRYAQEIQLQCDPGDVEDTQLLGQVADPNALRLIICIKSKNSLQLIRDARHIQSDISFKRIAGWLEFELGGFDRVNMFDTGKHIQYRHLHATSSDNIEFPGILSWSVDQHRGQAKGIGEYLQAVAPYQKYDLYEPTKLLSELGPYEHLRRILRLRLAHYARNIQKSVVSQEVKDAMFSLHGVIHKDRMEASWQATLSFIEKEGKKAGRDWVQDKIESKFAFPALCWQVTQQIPFKVWQACDNTTNVIEGLHQDQLQDGSSLTLLGGLLWGEQYDDMCLQNLKVYKASISDVNSKKRQFDIADTKIHEHNNKVRRIGNEMGDAREGVQETVQKVQAGIWFRGQLEQAENKVVKLETQYTKLIQESQRLKESGGSSGKVKAQEV